jgi:hypothetical protein
MKYLLIILVLGLIFFSGCTSVSLQEIGYSTSQAEVEETIGNLSTDIIDVGDDFSTIIEDI